MSRGIPILALPIALVPLTAVFLLLDSGWEIMLLLPVCFLHGAVQIIQSWLLAADIGNRPRWTFYGALLTNFAYFNCYLFSNVHGDGGSYLRVKHMLQDRLSPIMLVMLEFVADLYLLIGPGRWVAAWVGLFLLAKPRPKGTPPSPEDRPAASA